MDDGREYSIGLLKKKAPVGDIKGFVAFKDSVFKRRTWRRWGVEILDDRKAKSDLVEPGPAYLPAFAAAKMDTLG
jgi:hypothetical protein